MADLEAKVPEEIENELDGLLAVRGLPAGAQEEKIDVGARRQRAAPVTADRHHRDTIRLAGAVYLRDGEAVERNDDGILQRRQPPRARPAAAIGDELVLGGGAAVGQHLLQVRHDAGAGLRRQLAALAAKRQQAVAQGFAIDLEGHGCGLVHGPTT